VDEYGPASVDLSVAHNSPSIDFAASLTARERVALFCAATGIEHPKMGLISVIQALRNDGLIVYDGSSARCILTEWGRWPLPWPTRRGHGRLDPNLLLHPLAWAHSA
jgi:hypothetical protein